MGRREVRIRANFRYGDDDPTQWPQPYLADHPHLGAIPRKPDSPDDTLSLMWWEPSSSDFVLCRNSLVTGLGKLQNTRIRALEKMSQELRKRVAEYKATSKKPHHAVLALDKAMHHACIRLDVLPSSEMEMRFGVAEFQRYYLELVAALDYLEVFQPRMIGTMPAPDTVEKRVGIFTTTPRIAEEFFSAGLPVWLVQDEDVAIASTINVVAHALPRQPHLYVCLQDYDPVFPNIYIGRSDVPLKHTAIHRYSRTWLVYGNPFDDEVSTSPDIDPFNHMRGSAQGSNTIPMSTLLQRQPVVSSSKQSSAPPKSSAPASKPKQHTGSSSGMIQTTRTY